VASAGHPPFLWLHADGRLEATGATGPALGLFEGAVFGEHRLSLERGDRVLFYTDGVFDAGLDRRITPEDIGAALARIERAPNALERLLDSLWGASERQDRDDITLLLLDASPGESCFAEPGHGTAGGSTPSAAPPRIGFAESDDATFLILEGRVTWLYGQALLDAALGVVDDRRRLCIDLGACTHLDSTLLGTLYEIVSRADAAEVPVTLQNVSSDLVAAFTELSMSPVLERIANRALPVPAGRKVLQITESDPARQRQRLIKAHEVLAELSVRNREEFASVVEALKGEREAKP
jgi:anti-anti-sigma regulatory factor